MSKATQKIITLNIKGSDKAITGTEEMLDSVIDALRNQYPKLKIETTVYMGSYVEKPILMVPTKLHGAPKSEG